MPSSGAESYQAQAKAWLQADFDSSTRRQLQKIIDDNDQDALKQAFDGRMEFGTAGLRGLMGVGPVNMNRLVIRQTTAGLADHLLAVNKVAAQNHGVVIAYDGRHGSNIFAEDAAGVLAARGVKVLLFDKMHPTPLGAFAVKHLNAVAGVVVTASHNPPQYNGYKVYWQGGNQINDPIDEQIAAAISHVAAKDSTPKALSLSDAQSVGLLQYLGDEVFASYQKELLKTVSVSGAKGKDGLVVAYTPLHGVGAPFAEALLKQTGISNVHTVKVQREADGDFPTVNFPNPEEKGAMDLVIALADEKDAQIAVANDPDADRLAACARTKDGKMRQLTGDQLGSLLGERMLSRAPKGSWALSTVVSSRLLSRLALDMGAQHQETLTGFKWLGAVAKNIQERGDHFAFAYEEALGYMVSPMVWDKDGLTAIVALCELAAELNASGESLWDQLERIQRRVGASVTMPRTIRLSHGSQGSDLMKKLRADLPKSIAHHQVIMISDLLDNPKKPADPKQVPKNDVLSFYFADETHSASSSEADILLGAPRIIVRPSGTEPKVKIYCEKLGKIGVEEQYESAMRRIESDLNDLVDAFYTFAIKL
ncbi:putative phosphomannomutase [Tilletiaria anomala UBC 951]|uniref:Putative phosphomannomutase n=1 Tax=Tilletiaria anomala (strain ATCC 24038 / CBS 436.72 / UBC 951) TaxID=1037660 RepID=A0A066WKZ7_TILAU|nr:putative phosphomannomutase [Tilletiaria anomala UBC 951]KDN53248.1 putative phosphomannomutase [Tilletiaria anomala UBC 951]